MLLLDRRHLRPVGWPGDLLNREACSRPFELPQCPCDRTVPMAGACQSVCCFAQMGDSFGEGAA
ncbi:hypothetical protein BOSEA31B_13132 [Hyphomicrobiales bacterium]|nr:hypothetical protein BOSEA31B_13132 [Hyphomicrobiales bacterium]CAH1698906.1 hypothetical protein BOSEA1005_11959 [Hyphomicrobiales bacterium]